MTQAKLTSAQRRTLRDGGIDTAKVYIRRDPDAPKGAEREAAREAHRRLLAQERDLSKRKAELVREFLRTDPEASVVNTDLADLRARKEIVAGRVFRRAVEIIRDGGWCTHVLGGGDTFADAASKVVTL